MSAGNPGSGGGWCAGAALGVALRHAPFVILTVAYFVCGMQLIFLTTHLPSYLQICGLDPMLGAQALGEDNVDKRISALAMAIQMGATVYDLEEAELCYAPPFGSAKDPVNFAGMVPADVLRGDMPLCHWSAVGSGFLLDVRNPPELAVESVPSALNIPLPELRARLGELPRDREIHVICRSAQRAYYATRILVQNGFKARSISGGMLSRAMVATG